MCWQLRATVGKFLNCKLCFSSLELTCLFWVWQLWRHLKNPILWHISSSSHPKPSLKKMLEMTIWRLWKWQVFFAKIPGIIHLGIIILWSRITAQNIYPFLSHISLWTLKNSHNLSLPPLVAKLLRTTIPWHSFYQLLCKFFSVVFNSFREYSQNTQTAVVDTPRKCQAASKTGLSIVFTLSCLQNTDHHSSEMLQTASYLRANYMTIGFVLFTNK